MSGNLLFMPFKIRNTIKKPHLGGWRGGCNWGLYCLFFVFCGLCLMPIRASATFTT